MARQSSGKHTKSRQSSAAQRREQQRQAATQHAQQQQRNRRKVQRRSKRGLWIALGSALVVVAVVIGIFIYISSQSSTNNTYPTTPADPTIVQEVTSVNPSVLAAVGTGKVANVPKKISGSPQLLKGPTGKPEVFYYGGEFCPFCAAERWSMIVALSRFGTFHNLRQTSSSSTDVYPNTPTFSFYHSSYTSQYVDFVPVEGQSYQDVTLQQLTPDQQQLINTYDSGGNIPFIDIANKYTLSGASYDPQVLNGQNAQSIASALSNPRSPISQSILGTANYFTAAICEATNQQPANVCKAAPIPQVEQALNNASGNNGMRGNSSLSFLAARRRSYYG